MRTWTLEIVKLLTEKGANSRTTHDLPIRHAAQDGHFKIVEFLADKGADTEQALQIAIQCGHLEIAKLLVDKKADIYADDNMAMRCAA